MSTHYEKAPAPVEEAGPSGDPQESHARHYLRLLASTFFILSNIALIYLAVDARSDLMAAQSVIQDSALEPEFMSLAVRSAVIVTVAGIAISYVIARSLEVFVLSRLRKRDAKLGHARTVDVTTLIVFGAAAFWDTQVISLATAAPAWAFIAVPPLVAALQSLGDRRSRRRFGVVMLVSAIVCALSLLAYGRWF